MRAHIAGKSRIDADVACADQIVEIGAGKDGAHLPDRGGIDPARLGRDDVVGIHRAAGLAQLLDIFGGQADGAHADELRSEGHTSELQSLMRISYAVICLQQNTIMMGRHEDATSLSTVDEVSDNPLLANRDVQTSAT